MWKSIVYQFNPYTVEEDELFNTIEFLLKDEMAKSIIKKISNNMKNSQETAELAEKINKINTIKKSTKVKIKNLFLSILKW